MKLKTPFRAIAFVLAAMLACSAARAQDFPNKPITMVVPFAVAGSADLLGRVLAQHMGEFLGQNVVVEFKPGGGSMIGSEYVARVAKPDGYTVMLTGNPIAINVALMKLNFDPRKELVPVAGIAGFVNVMVISASSPITSVAEFVRLAKTEHFTFGSSGPGTSSHMSGELFKSMANIDITHVPYRGSGAVYPDLIAGRVTTLFDVAGSATSFINGGKVRALGVTSKTRSRGMPNVPTLDEQGVTGYEALTWFGMFAPGGTPPQIIARLEQAAIKAIQTPAIAQRLNEWGAEPLAMQSAAKFAEFYRDDVERWEALVRAGKVKRLE